MKIRDVVQLWFIAFLMANIIVGIGILSYAWYDMVIKEELQSKSNHLKENQCYEYNLGGKIQATDDSRLHSI